MRHRGHVIVKIDNDGGDVKWVKHYLAYNAHPEWMMPILESHAVECFEQTKACRTGISQFDGDTQTNWGRFVGEYHDHNNYDIYKHETTTYDTLDSALLSCSFNDIYVWDGDKWSHHTISVEAKAASTPPRKPKKNIWREMRKSRDVGDSSIENKVSE